MPSQLGSKIRTQPTHHRKQVWSKEPPPYFARATDFRVPILPGDGAAGPLEKFRANTMRGQKKKMGRARRKEKGRNAPALEMPSAVAVSIFYFSFFGDQHRLVILKMHPVRSPSRRIMPSK
jgi:hypothetical protein